MQRERRAVEHQFVLAADLVEIDQRQGMLGDARDREIEPRLVLVAPIGRAVRHDQDFGAGLGEALDHLLAPDVLADRDAEPNAAEIDRAGQRPGRKHPLLVEHAVIRQIDLETQSAAIRPRSRKAMAL